MSYTSFGSAASTADKAAAEAQKWNEQYEEHAGSVDPEVKAYLAMRDSVFAIADQLGIGQQVRVLYHTTAVSAKGGMVGGTAGGAAFAIAEQAALPGGTAVAAQYSSAIGTGAAIGMTAGMVVGAAIAIFSLFTDDSDAKAEERAKRKKEREKAQAYLLSRLDLTGLTKEQQHNASVARLRASDLRASAASLSALLPSLSQKHINKAVAYDKAAAGADNLVALYQQIGQLFKPADIKLFESSANLQRWQFALDANEAAIQQYAKLFAFGVQEGSQEFSKNLRSRITVETQVFKDLVAAARKKPAYSLSKGLIASLFPKKTLKKTTTVTPQMSPAAGLFTGLVVVGSGLAILHMWRAKRRRR